MGEITQIEILLYYKEEHNRNTKQVLSEHRKKLVPVEWIKGRTCLGCNMKGQIPTGRNGRWWEEICESILGEGNSTLNSRRRIFL